MPALRLSELVDARELILVLSLRDFRLRYRQTMLGPVWIMVQPLASAAALAFVVGRVGHVATQGLPVFLFVYSGTVVWQVFASSALRAGSSLLANAHLITKVYFPRLALPVAAASSALVDVLVGTCVLVVLNVVFGTHPSALGALLLPVWVAIAAVSGLALGTLVASVSVRWRDVQHLMTPLMQVWLLISPVAYPVSAVPSGLRSVYEANPMVGLVQGFRWSAMGGQAPTWSAAVVSAAFAASVALLSLIVFRRAEARLSDII